MDDFDLVQFKLELECITVSSAGVLLRIDGQTCDDIEMILAIKLSNEERHVLLHRENVIDHEGLSPEILFANPEAFVDDLHPLEIRRETWYYFTMAPDLGWQPGHEVYVVENLHPGHQHDEFIGQIEGLHLSKAWSVRQNERAAEVAVETAEEYRRRGLAKGTVTAWIKKQLELKKIPLYAHRPNLASQRLAESLGAIKFAEVVSYQ